MGLAPILLQFSFVGVSMGEDNCSESQMVYTGLVVSSFMVFCTVVCPSTICNTYEEEGVSQSFTDSEDAIVCQYVAASYPGVFCLRLAIISSAVVAMSHLHLSRFCLSNWIGDLGLSNTPDEYSISDKVDPLSAYSNSML